MSTIAVVAAIVSGITGVIAGLAALLKSRTDAATAVARAAMELLAPTQEQVKFLSGQLDEALAQVARLRARINELEEQLNKRERS